MVTVPCILSPWIAPENCICVLLPPYCDCVEKLTQLPLTDPRIGSVPDPRGSLIEPCKLFPFCWRLSCKVRYCGPSVVTVHFPLRSLSVEDEAWEEGRSGGGASFAGPSELAMHLLAGVVDVLAGGVVQR